MAMAKRAVQNSLPGMEDQKPESKTTKLGYSLGEVTSALIKCLRQGQEQEAAFWACELYDGAPYYCWKRLLLFASEDVGIGDPEAVKVVVALAQGWTLAASYQRHPYVDPEQVVQAVLTLARARKDTTVDDLKNLVYLRRKAIKEGIRRAPPIPDMALDCHTPRGKEMGRGNKHWYDMRETYLPQKSEYQKLLEKEFPGYVLTEEGQPW